MNRLKLMNENDAGVSDDSDDCDESDDSDDSDDSHDFDDLMIDGDGGYGL